MQTIDFSTITVPTPAAYDSANPHQQRENLCYVLLQILAQCSGTMDIDLAEQIGGLAVTGETFEMPGFKVKRSGRVISIVTNP